MLEIYAESVIGLTAFLLGQRYLRGKMSIYVNLHKPFVSNLA